MELWLRWLPFLVNTAFLYVLAPLAFWTAFCVSAARVDFGVAIAALFGMAGTYLTFGFSLLLACIGTTAVASRLTRLRCCWQRLASGVLTGVFVGVLMGGYIVLKLARDRAAISGSAWPGQSRELFSMSLAAGALLGVALPGLWSLSCFFAFVVSRAIAEPGASPNVGPAAPLKNIGGVEGPPSVS